MAKTAMALVFAGKIQCWRACEKFRHPGAYGVNRDRGTRPPCIVRKTHMAAYRWDAAREKRRFTKAGQITCNDNSHGQYAANSLERRLRTWMEMRLVGRPGSWLPRNRARVWWRV